MNGRMQEQTLRKPEKQLEKSNLDRSNKYRGTGGVRKEWHHGDHAQPRRTNASMGRWNLGQGGDSRKRKMTGCPDWVKTPSKTHSNGIE